MEWINYAISILSGLTVAIPLVIKLVEYINKSIKEKNWGKLIALIINLIPEAESKFGNGAERKEWVISMVKSSADTIDYDIDISVVSDLIDSLCKMTKVVNTVNQSKK